MHRITVWMGERFDHFNVDDKQKRIKGYSFSLQRRTVVDRKNDTKTLVRTKTVYENAVV